MVLISLKENMVSSFTAVDYVLFAALLLLSSSIGIYQACRGGSSSTTEALQAGKSLNFVPVALSILASFFSASTLLGTPAEIYLRGSIYWISIVGAVLPPFLGAFVFGPFFHKLNILTVFEYLESRYNGTLIRRIAALLFCLRAVIGAGIVLYGPATALSAVTPLPTWAAIVATGAVATFYTTIGGMKAVVWTDVFQMLLMFCGMLAVIIKGSISVGGMNEVWKIADRGGRLKLNNLWSFDPTIRHTFWSLTIGIFFVWLPPYSVDQQMVQRFTSTKTLNQARLALLFNAPGMAIIISLCCLTGLVMYARYENCDPLSSGKISNSNQLLPYFVMDVLSDAKGLPGLFVACILSGALSSISSMLNSLAAVLWKDILSAFVKIEDDKTATKLTKFLVVVFGAFSIGAAFAVGRLQGTVLQMSLTLNGSLGSPLVGMFLLAVFVPWSGQIGSLIGSIVGLGISMWLSLGAFVTKPNVLDNLPVSTSGCIVSNISTVAPVVSTVPNEVISGIKKFYSLSYLWNTSIGIVLTVFIGMVLSAIFRENHRIRPNMMLSYLDTFWPCVPKKLRDRCRSRRITSMKMQEDDKKAEEKRDKDEETSKNSSQ
ncbi:unnamed protein product [Dimorphilus gyrociliatus]|uniref:Uncharacterized protein n=1 Tax=Dimorphilus gyrociliatus TaxID=2664684 RepID=A0A7I8VIZ1_9ANNE|nr:unnamed protein product [Dimorphilus gyrociliatus]